MRNEMAVVIARWDNGKVNTEVVICQDTDEATEEIKKTYITEIRNFNTVMWEDTYITDDLMYAQVSSGTLRTEIVIGKIK